MRTVEAMKLKNARDKEAGRKPTANGINLARLLFPNQTPGTQTQSANKLLNNRNIRMTGDQIQIICHELGVDTNFLHDFPSIHDEDYKRLILDHVDN